MQHTFSLRVNFAKVWKWVAKPRLIIYFHLQYWSLLTIVNLSWEKNIWLKLEITFWANLYDIGQDSQWTSCAEDLNARAVFEDTMDIAGYKVDDYILSQEIGDLNKEIDEIEKQINEYNQQVQTNDEEKEEIYQMRIENEKQLDSEITTLQNELINTNKISYSYNQFTMYDDGTLDAINDDYQYHDTYYTDSEIKKKWNEIDSCGEWVTNNDWAWWPSESMWTSILSDGTFTDIWAKYQLSTCDS